MIRVVLGVLAGAVVAVLVVAGIEAAGHAIYPPPAGTDLKNPDNLKNIMSLVPLGAKVAVIVAWFLGALVGGYAAVRLARNALASYAIAALMIAGGIYSLTVMPHPLWMQVGAIAAPLIGAFLASLLGRGAIKG